MEVNESRWTLSNVLTFSSDRDGIDNWNAASDFGGPVTPPAYLNNTACCVIDTTWALFGSIMFKRTDKVDCKEMQFFGMTVIEIRPFRSGWQVYEAPGVQPVFLSHEQANVLSQTSSRPYRDKMTSRSSSRLVLVFAPLVRLNPTRTVALDTSQSAVLRSPRPAIQLC